MSRFQLLQPKYALPTTTTTPDSNSLQPFRPLGLTSLPSRSTPTEEHTNICRPPLFEYSFATIPLFPPIQRKAGLPSPLQEESQLGSRIQAARSNGHPLDTQTRHQLEQGLGVELSGIRVHTDSEADHLARTVNATAFTTGADIFFLAGMYHPSSSQGMHLLAHEITHSVQQATGHVTGIPGLGGVSLSTPGDHFEQLAEASAYRIITQTAHPQEDIKRIRMGISLEPTVAAHTSQASPLVQAKPLPPLIRTNNGTNHIWIQRMWQKTKPNDSTDPWFVDEENNQKYDASTNKFYGNDGKPITEKEIIAAITSQQSFKDLKSPIKSVKKHFQNLKKKEELAKIKEENVWERSKNKEEYKYYSQKHKMTFDALYNTFSNIDGSIIFTTGNKEHDRLQNLVAQSNAITKQDRKEIDDRKRNLHQKKPTLQDIDIEGISSENLQFYLQDSPEQIHELKKTLLGGTQLTSDEARCQKAYVAEKLEHLKLLYAKADQDKTMQSEIIAVMQWLSSLKPLINHFIIDKKDLELQKERDESFKQRDPLGHKIRDLDQKTKLRWWNLAIQQKSILQEIVVHKSIQEIAKLLQRDLQKLALQALQICGKASRTKRYLTRLDKTVKQWPRLDGLKEHLQKIFQGTDYTAFHGGVPEIEVASQAVSQAVGNVQIGSEINLKDSSKKQEMDVAFKGRTDGKQHYREVKADVNALVKKYGGKSSTQLTALKEISGWDNTEVTIVCKSTTGWINIFNTNTAKRIISCPLIDLQIGESLFTNKDLKFIEGIIAQYQKKLGDQWKEWEWRQNWKTPGDFIQWAIDIDRREPAGVGRTRSKSL